MSHRQTILLRPENVPQMARVHAATFAEPWSEAALASLLETPGCFGLGVRTVEASPTVEHLQDGEALDGFILIRQAADEAEILTLAVSPEVRRMGLASSLLKDAMVQTMALGAATLFLEVAEDNQAARALYAAFGFSEIARRRGYYAATGSDALILEHKLGATGAV